MQASQPERKRRSPTCPMVAWDARQPCSRFRLLRRLIPLSSGAVSSSSAARGAMKMWRSLEGSGSWRGFLSSTPRWDIGAKMTSSHHLPTLARLKTNEHRRQIKRKLD
ncbi:unnamed protein product [Symbiodinium sp. CCMP2592]|nr:unnamed protein product [Symbiodinium sp. CCMP2592]